jgi:formate hydrogenlyase transcriptional activator
MELILRLQPETRRIVIIGGTAEVDRLIFDKAKEAARSFSGQVEFDFWNKSPMAEMRQSVTSLSPKTVLLFTRMYRDAAGEIFIPARAAQLIAESANVPLYVLNDPQVGVGAVGGFVVDDGLMGKRAGELANRILNGTAPASLPFEIRTDGVPMFDWRALKRWGISESRLPPGSVVRFREPTFWEQYHWYIIGALAIMAVQAVLIVGLLLHRARRRRAEVKLRESQEFMELSTSAGELGLWVRDLGGDELWANPRLRSLFGFGQNDVLRFENVIDRIHPDDRARVIAEVERTQRTGHPFEDEFRVMIPDGSERWVAARGRTVDEPNHNRTRRMGVVFDITERKRAERGLNAALVEIRGLKERLEEENLYLKEEISEVKGFDEIVGESDALKYVLTRVEQVAKTDATVLLQGETGVGKELIARAIHEMSSRSNGQHVKVNCATLPEALVESELFGHERGAFTGADRQRKGRFELADAGTILLDEVAELPAGTQAKLLRVLQEGEFERVGGSSTIKVSVRIIAATNRKLHDEVSAGRFRQDLFYRLNVYPITVPPLRERREDIPLLVSHYARQIGERLGKSISEVPAQVMREFTEYNWPGNIRELQNVIERAVIVSSDGVLRLPEPLVQATSAPAREGITSNYSTTVSTADEAEREHILRALEATGWRINGPKGAAAVLKLHPSTLRFRLKKLGLTKSVSYM